MTLEEKLALGGMRTTQPSPIFQWRLGVAWQTFRAAYPYIHSLFLLLNRSWTDWCWLDEAQQSKSASPVIGLGEGT